MMVILVRLRPLALLLAAAVLMMVARPLRAHHSIATGYDLSKAVSLKGTVTELVWTNPHIYFFIDVIGDGNVERWAVQSGTPKALSVRGWRKDTLKPGDTVTVDGWLAKDGSKLMSSSSVTLEDGLKLLTDSAVALPRW